jgi:hypothetical protein
MDPFLRGPYNVDPAAGAPVGYTRKRIGISASKIAARSSVLRAVATLAVELLDLTDYFTVPLFAFMNYPPETVYRASGELHGLGHGSFG